MNKKICAVFFLVVLGTFVWAKVGDKMYVNVQEATLKSGTGFFASENGVLPYGAQVKVLAEKGKWVEIVSAVDNSLKGWVPLSSLTKKKILNDGLFSVSASTEELALAGKGFSAEVENLYKTPATQDIYALLDSIESKEIDKEELFEFVVEGKLSGAEE